MSIVVAIITCCSFLTGCWDRAELNNLAIELGWGIDKVKGKQIEVSSQYIIPSKMAGSMQAGGGGKGKSFFVESGIGRDNLEAAQKMQTKLSREEFRGHRRVIVLGEAMARSGLNEVLDTYTRDPQVRWRTDIFVVKGGTAKDFLSLAYPLENVPILGAVKEHDQMGLKGESAFLNLLIAATSDGTRAALPAIEMSPRSQSSDESGGQSENPTTGTEFGIVGTAVFDKNLKLVGYLNLKNKFLYHWIRGELEKQIFFSQIKQRGEHATFCADLTHMTSKIRTQVKGQRINVSLTLRGIARIRENNTGLDLKQSQNLLKVRQALESQLEQETLRTVQTLQQKYGTDILGFGDAIHRQHPMEWQHMKKDWDNLFPRASTRVSVKLSVLYSGLTGKSAHLP